MKNALNGFMIFLIIIEMQGQSSHQINEPLLSQRSQVRKDEVVSEQAPKLPPAPFFSLFSHTTKCERALLIVGSLAAIVAGAAFPFFLLFVGDITTIFTQAKRDKAIQNGLKLFFELIVVGAVVWIGNSIGLYFWNIVGANQAVRIKKIYYKTLLDQEVAYYDEHDPHKIVTKVSTSLTAIQGATGQKMSLLLSTVFTSFCSIFLAYFKCWQLSLVLTAMIPLIMVGFVLFMKAMVNYSQRDKIAYQAAASRTEQSIGQIRTVKSLVGQDFQMNIFKGSLDQGKSKTVKYCLWRSLANGLIILIFISIYPLGFWYGKKLITDSIDTGEYDVSVIFSAFLCFLIGGSSIGQLSPFFKNIAQGRVAMADFIQITTRKKTLVEPEHGIQIQKIKDITIKGVNFSYKPDQPILKDLNISFENGKVSALVGQSGCGKSTVVQLLMRYYDCTAGQISISDRNIKELDMNSYRRKIGFVGQQPVLFAMSIAENLRLADPSLTEQKMIQILKKANAWQFVEKMQKKLDTYVGSGGTQLSGGQKQRIAIARALCKYPQILILDEATSALDRKNERQIQQTLNNLQSNGITTIVIAHRLSTIKEADCIFVLKKGELIQKGNHQQLINKKGIYDELVKTQVAAQQDLSNQIRENDREAQQQQKSQVSTKAGQKNEEEAKLPSEQKQKAVFKKLLNFEKSNFKLLVIGVLGALVAGLVWPFFNYALGGVMSLLIDPVTNNDELNRQIIMMAIVAAVAGISTATYTLAFGIASQNIVYKVRMSMFAKLLRLPVSFYDKKENTAGAISSKLATDVFQINNMVSGVIGVVCLNVATVGGSLGLAFAYSWQITLISLGVSPLLIIMGAINMKVMLKLTNKSQETQKFLGSLMSDSVCNIRTVKSFGRPMAFASIFDGKLQQLHKVNQEKHLKTAILQGMGKGMIMLVEGIIFLLAAILFQNHQVEDGRAVFTAVFSIIFAAMGVGQNSQFMPDMAKAKVSGAGVFDILQTKGEDQLSLENGGVFKGQIQGAIQFKNVTFKYPQREKIVLQNLSFAFGKQKIALVGHSGSGKSTIVQLLLRFYDVESGQILLDGKNIKEYNIYDLRKQIGLVSQQPSLFLGTVKQNIQYNSGCSQDQLGQAIKIANAQKFINSWDQKFQKEVGVKGGQISGGQKQRIALSRCLVRKSNMYLFDEFTSALDADTQKTVFENMKAVLRGKTSVSVAHRLSTVEDCDRILVFKDGRIIQEGTYSSLMQLKQHFYSLAQGS